LINRLARQILLRLKPGYPHRSQVSFCTWSYDLPSGSLHRDTAPVPSAMLLHLDSKPATMQLVPRFRQLAIILAPGWQKPRHASLLTAGAWTLPRMKMLLQPSVTQQRLLTLTAGPLAANRSLHEL
jgi:hypothetical protein